MTYTMKQKREYAQWLREKMTDAERLLWGKICNRQLGYRFVRQGLLWGYIADFYCAKARLAIEVDGSVHKMPEKATEDKGKDKILAEYGIAVMRFGNDEVFGKLGMVLDDIRRECHFRTEGALKGFSSRVVENETKNKDKSKRACGLVEGSANCTEISAIKENSQASTAPEIPRQQISLADYRDIRERLYRLVNRKAIPYYDPPSVHKAWEQRYRLAEYAKRKEQASVRPAESAESAKTGTTERATANNLGEGTKQG